MRSNVIYTSLASFPGKDLFEACEKASKGAVDPYYGKLSFEKVQLVPQNKGFLDEGAIDTLKEKYPSTDFRLHANVRILYNNMAGLRITDLSNYATNIGWFKQAAALSKRLNAKVYTLHSGYAKNASLQEIVDNCMRIQDMFDCPVGIEGQYPNRHEKLLVCDWQEYEFIMNSGCYFVVDLSHLNILSEQLGPNPDLAKALVAHPNCIEVHVSANNGKADTHSCVTHQEWWDPLLATAPSTCDIFYEGNLLK